MSDLLYSMLIIGSAILVPTVVALYALLKLRKLETELEVVAEHAPAAIAHVTGQGPNLKYRFVNRRYAELYGFTPDAVTGKHPREVLGEDLFARAESNMKKAIAGETVVFDLPFKGRMLEVTYAPDTRSPGFIGVIRDTSDERKAKTS